MNATTAPPAPNRWLRGALAVVGLFILFFSLNMTLGGFETLGWEGRSDFVEATNQDDFDIQDNHVRFASGLWTAIGLLFLAATRWLAELKEVLIGALAFMVFGGIARLTSGVATFKTADILLALFLEFVVVPAMAWWIWRTTGAFARPKM